MTPDPRLAALRAAADRCEVRGFDAITIATADLSFLLDALAAAEGERDRAVASNRSACDGLMHQMGRTDEVLKERDALAARLEAQSRDVAIAGAGEADAWRAATAAEARLAGLERVREAAMALVAEIHSGNHDARLSLPGEYDTLLDALTAASDAGGEGRGTV